MIQEDMALEWKFKHLFEASRSKPRIEVPVEELNVLDADVWFSPTGRAPTLRNIAHEFKRVEQVDPGCPAIIVRTIGLIDGTHRLIKALLRGERSLACVEFDMEELKALPHKVQRGFGKSLP